MPIPVNPTTVNILANATLATARDMEVWLEKNQMQYPDGPQNSEEMAKSRVGNVLYEKIFRPYTLKQWEREPSQLAPEVLGRIPVHASFDTRYFTDKFQALPARGYTRFVERILDQPSVRTVLSTNFFEVKNKLKFKTLVFTGPIDAYFSSLGLPALEYRSLRFEHVVLRNTPYYQPNSVVNYPATEVPYTRIVEHKHFLNQQSPHTVYSREYPSAVGEPYYPILNARNQALYKEYQEAASRESSVHFLGRLASFKYFNMDAAILNALHYFDKHFL